jgi:hypothetical protein
MDKDNFYEQCKDVIMFFRKLKAHFTAFSSLERKKGPFFTVPLADSFQKIK